MNNLPKLRPTMIKGRISYVFIQKSQIDVIDGVMVVISEDKAKVQIPIATITCIFLEPGTRISHAAVSLCSKVGCLLVWVGEGGIRVYSVGKLNCARTDRFLKQVEHYSDEKLKLEVVRKMYKYRFKCEPPQNRSAEQLRGLEGARIRNMYKLFAKQFGVSWKNRKYNVDQWGEADLINKSLSVATSCLYGISESAVLAAGYSSELGFLHSGKPLSFVYDVADLIKFETVVPYAFKMVSVCKGKDEGDIEKIIRKGCRDMFREKRILKTIIPLINSLFYEDENDCDNN
jgi:CRISPR-associated protein Cas1